MINVQLGQHVAQRSEVELGARLLAGAHLMDREIGDKYHVVRIDDRQGSGGESRVDA
jgi:hypothetical protein